MRFWALTVVANCLLGQAGATNVKRESVEHFVDTYDFVSSF